MKRRTGLVRGDGRHHCDPNPASTPTR
jgi:hypothetical protein